VLDRGVKLSIEVSRILDEVLPRPAVADEPAEDPDPPELEPPAEPDDLRKTL
jgi:hypothetical protein